MIKTSILALATMGLLVTESEARSRSRQIWSFVGGVAVGAALSNQYYYPIEPIYQPRYSYGYQPCYPVRQFRPPCYYYPSGPMVVTDCYGVRRIIPQRMR